MLTNILWGAFLVILIIFVLWGNKKKNYKPYRKKTEQEKEIEKQIAIEKEKSRGVFPWI